MATKWSSASAASAFKHQIFYFLIKCGGRSLAYVLLYGVVLFYALFPGFRKRGAYYLRRRFLRGGAWALFKHTYRHYLTLGKVLVDRATLGITGKIQVLSSPMDQALCRSLYQQGKGLVIVTAHAGCWQSAMASFDFIEGAKYVLYHRVKEDVDKQAHEHGKTKQTVQFIDPAGYGGGAVEILAALGKNAIICTMFDREFGSQKNSLTLPFLGGEIRVPAAIYRIAAAHGTPVAVVFFPFEGAGKFSSIVADHFIAADRGANLENYTEYALRPIKALERFCEQYPYQFFNFYNMWEK